MIKYIKIILQGLTDKNPSDSEIVKKTIQLLDEQETLPIFIEDMKRELQRIKDFRGDREPFYRLYLSVGYLMQKNHKLAKESLSNAIQGFQIQGFSLNEALGEWLFGITHFDNGNNDRAQRAWDAASITLQKLITQTEEESKYQKAAHYKGHLENLNKCRAGAISPASTGKDKPRDGVRSPFTSGKEQYHYNAFESNKPWLEKYRKDLEHRRDYLKSHKMRVPPTLVATIFYLYKTLAPSHSVYSPVPAPLTDREKKVYEELLGKVGAFEVVEQLVELESGFEPGASREELLEKINRDWENDVKEYPK